MCLLTCRFTPGSCCCLGLGFLDCLEPLGRAPSCCICCCWCRKLPRSIFGNFDTWLPARAPSRLERRDPFLRPLTAAWPILHDECGPPMPPDLSRCKGRDLIMSLHAATRDVAADDSAHALLCPDVAADDAAEAGSDHPNPGSCIIRSFRTIRCGGATAGLLPAAGRMMGDRFRDEEPPIGRKRGATSLGGGSTSLSSDRSFPNLFR